VDASAPDPRLRSPTTQTPGAVGRSRRYRDVSLWLDQVATSEAGDGDLAPRAGASGRLEADVVVVGGGLTGLWTAYYLTEADPDLDVLVVEQEVVGFGASGRNGGWCSALFPVGAAAIAREHGREAAAALRSAMRDTVVEVGGVAAAEEIDCDFAYGGTVTLARSPAQLARARRAPAEGGPWGDEVQLLDADAARQRLAATQVLGATYTPDCARVHPGRLVRGLADVLERRGVRIAERTSATDLEPGWVRVEHEGRRGTIRCRTVIRATEAWTAHLGGSRRTLAPVYSLMIATEPLPADVWDELGLREHETFADHRHLVVYGQRTADDRIAFGGRGAPYHWRSSIRPEHDHASAVHDALARTLAEMLPAVAGARITHRWGGPIGIARDWHPSVGLGPDGIGWAGGYVGDGVATTNLAGRTLADLVTGQETPLTRLPWVNHRSRRWEPEPLRWLGVNAGLRAMTVADAEERLTRRESLVARAMAPLVGH
jgi:glycine/D-amino acid oxidase-like deaminating enzyme